MTPAVRKYTNVTSPRNGSYYEIEGRAMAKLLTQRAVKGRQEIRDRKRVAIAAIDFGTTFCSLAYTLSDEDKVNLIELNRHHQQRVPTAIYCCASKMTAHQNW